MITSASLNFKLDTNFDYLSLLWIKIKIKLLFVVSQYGGYTPSWVKTKYGAWYLAPGTWTKRAADEVSVKIEKKTSVCMKPSGLDLSINLLPIMGANINEHFLCNNSLYMIFAYWAKLSKTKAFSYLWQLKIDIFWIMYGA